MNRYQYNRIAVAALLLTLLLVLSGWASLTLIAAPTRDVAPTVALAVANGLREMEACQ